MRMNRNRTTTSILQSALCLCLSPLLAAQQVQQQAPQRPIQTVAVTAADQPAYKSNAHETFVEFGAPDSVSFEEEKTGSAVQFVVDKDVVVQGVTILQGGIPLTGTIARVKYPSERRHRGGQLDILLNDPVSQKIVRVRLLGASPIGPITPGDPWNDLGSRMANDPGVHAMSIASIFHGILIAFGIIFLLGVLAALRQ